MGDMMDQALGQFGDAIFALYEASNALHDGVSSIKTGTDLMAEAERRIDKALEHARKG